MHERIHYLFNELTQELTSLREREYPIDAIKSRDLLQITKMIDGEHHNFYLLTEENAA